MRLIVVSVALSFLVAGCGQSPVESADDPTTVAAAPSSSSSAAGATSPDRGIGDFPKLSAATDWPWWRGPSRNGIALQSAPTTWSATENVAWKTPVQGRGHSSPIVVGDRIFLATADEGAKTQSLVAFDRTSGKELWNKEVSQGGFPARIHGKNTHASPTPACDGERVYITFFHHDTLQTTAIDLDGNQKWQKTVGTFRPRSYEYGYAPSPVLYRNTVIVAGECDNDSYIAALDLQTGNEAWTIQRPKNITYSTPAIAFVNGRDQMFLSGADRIASYDPNTGNELWSTKGCAAATCGTAVWHKNLIFASGGYPKAETVAVRADGSGQAWKNSQKCYEQSMIAVEGYVYGLTDGGVLFCWRADDGKEMWKQRLKGPVSASPVYTGGHIYWANELGTLYVFRPNPDKYDHVADNVLGDESMASPAIAQGQLFLRVADSSGGRGQETLYCLGK